MKNISIALVSMLLLTSCFIFTRYAVRYDLTEYENIEIARAVATQIKERLKSLEGMKFQESKGDSSWYAYRGTGISVAWYESVPHLDINEAVLIMIYDHIDRRDPLVDEIKKILKEETDKLPDGVLKLETYESHLPV